MYYLGYDIGSSSVKVAIVECHTGRVLGIRKEPEEEMAILSPYSGWAEQNPEDWWIHIVHATQNLLQDYKIDPQRITGIGIAYQMHGLVLLDAQGELLRNAIIWCDSRAVSTGDKALQDLGQDLCARSLLNAPGNLTISKLKWVKDNEPDLYAKVSYVLLPGDYIAYKLTNTINTTIPGLSEGIFWDYRKGEVASWLMEHLGLKTESLPPLVPTFGQQGNVSQNASEIVGLAEGTPVLYRAGDQPNNALTLSVLNPGEVAMTCGTSGVTYAIVDQINGKEISRINTFAHVTYTRKTPVLGKLICLNGAGILYRWLRDNLDIESYDEMNRHAESVPVGSDGLLILPFGNGSERLLFNKDLGAHIIHLDLNRHTKAHLCRAALEGIAFAFVYGIELLMDDGLKPEVFRAGFDNLFQSTVFSTTISTLIGHPIELYNATGAVGAARACSIPEKGITNYSRLLTDNDHRETVYPLRDPSSVKAAYRTWKSTLVNEL